jgi:hypothetical protein
MAVVSRRREVRERDLARAGWLRRLPAHTCHEWDGGGVRVAVCGAPREVAIAVGEAPGAPAAAVAGEIMNAASLRRELAAPADADAARLVLIAYERWGAGLFDHLEGAFALVVVDKRDDLVLAGADPYGVMPLSSVMLGEDVLLATEAKTFAADPRFSAAPDEAAVACMLATGHDMARGFFAGVSVLREGRHLEIRKGRLHEVTHWSPRESLGDLHGRAYALHLAEAMQSIAADVFAGDRLLLPLTGGLDSRLLATVCPVPEAVTAFTFGAADHPDALRAAQIAAAVGMRHQTVPFDPAYLRRHAAATVWLTEGRLPPVENITGFQMEAFGGGAFVSGVDSAVGRRAWKGRGALSDPRMLGRTGPEFAGWTLSRFGHTGVVDAEASLLFGAEGAEYRRRGIEVVTEDIAGSQDLLGVDRADLYLMSGRARSWRCAGLGLAGTWATPRAPFFTRRWIDAVLAGAPDERLDDLNRVRLLRLLGGEVAKVPWVSTGLSMDGSAVVLATLRELSRLRRGVVSLSDGLAGDGAGARVPGAPEAPGGTIERLRAASAHAVHAAYHRFYDYGDSRDDWLRGASRAYVRQVLLDERTAGRGFARPAGLRRLLDEHDAGRDHTTALSILLGLELWQRQFVDGDGPPDEVAAMVGGVPGPSSLPSDFSMENLRDSTA